MTNSSFLKKLIFAVSVVFFVSCDKDFNELGSDIVDGDIHTDMIRTEVGVVAYDRPTGAVQTNNATLNQLGVYDNPVFGKTVSHFVTQLEMASENPTIFIPQIDSVYMYVPYLSRATDADTDGSTIYELDSVYGKKDAKIKLQVYRNGFYLRDSDPGATDNLQRYYSDDRASVENLKVGTPLYENAEFTFSPKEIQINAKLSDGTTKLVERKAPGIFTYLDTIAVKQLFFSDANKSNLLNNNIFKNYFRGLYFKVEQTGDAVMAVPDFAKGTIIVKYRDYESRTDGIAGPNMAKPRISKTITFNLKGNTINFFENTYNNDFTSAITTSDAITGDSRLYVKGGAGSMAIIDIDTEGLKALMPEAMGEKILVNEANLTFFVDNTTAGMGKGEVGSQAVEPLRLYLYDLKNHKPLYDYTLDATSSSSRPKINKSVFGGIKNPYPVADRATQYKFKITNHINNIIKGDSTNVRLGLVVTETINTVTNYKLKTPFEEGVLGNEDYAKVEFFPLPAIQHPFGTILYGNNVPVGEQDKRLKLEIYYSKPKQ